MPLPPEGAAPRPTAVSPIAIAASPRRQAPATPRFAELLGGLARRVDAGEALVRHALGHDLGNLDAAALIAVQAGIYHYTEALELAGKLVDRATGAVRTVLQPGSP
jgi:hypothetical protein